VSAISVLTATDEPNYLEPRDMLGYLRLLFEPGDWINLQLIHQTETFTDNDGRVRKRIDNNFMTLEEALKPFTIELIAKKQDEGWNSYVAMNAFTPGSERRREKDIAAIRTVYVEFDENTQAGLDKIDADIDAGLIPPNDFLLRSSVDKAYVIWRVTGFDVRSQKALNKALQLRYGSDPQSVDAARVLRLPGTRNLKYDPSPVVEICNECSHEERNTPGDFKIEFAVKPMVNRTAAPEKVQMRMEFYEHACEQAGVDAGDLTAKDDGSYSYTVACPNYDQHTTGGKFDGSVWISPSGAISYACWHGHCASLDWKTFYRPWLEEQAKQNGFQGYLKFGEPDTQLILSTTTDANVAAIVATVDESSPDSIPAFDPTVITGIYAKFVELITRGTTMSPQFAFLASKVVVGARMAGKVRFESLDVEPRYYGAAIGETGSGKGEAWRRMMQILGAKGVLDCGIKIINSADSGAGIRDAFFEHPEDQTMLCYIDEVEGLGNKASATRNPAILDTMIELADSTQISRVLAKNKSGKSSNTKTKNDARFCMFMCGQDGDVFMKAFAGRTKLGMYDRLYPEYGVAVEAGELPPINTRDAFELLAELNKLDFSGTMTMSDDAKVRLAEFWDTQPPEVRKKARWKKNLALDAHMSAFGRGSKRVETEDVEIAIRQFVRQLVIRRVCFRSEAPDRVGFYLGKLKDLTSRMESQLAAGIAPELVAMSRRDYENATHAFRDNEAHIFERAWRVYEPVRLAKVKVRKLNGREYDKYLPLDE
jgi:RepB DNA-primase from phage plasmid